MDYYSLALFAHVVGALGFFVMLALEWVSLQHLQRAISAEQVNERLRTSAGLRISGIVSMILLLVPGFYMTIAVWGEVAWVSVSFSALVVSGLIGGILTAPRMSAIRKIAAGEHGMISADLARLLRHPLLAISLQMRVGVGLGIVYLMTVKPALTGSLVAVGIGALLGLAISLARLGSRRTPELAM